MTNFDNKLEGLRSDAIYAEVHRLVTEVLENASPQAGDSLADFLTDGGEEAQQCYVSYMQETNALRRAGTTASQLLPPIEQIERRPAPASLPTQSPPSRSKFLAVLLSVAAGLAIAISLWGPPESAPRADQDEPVQDVLINDTSVATLVRTTRVHWHPDDNAMPELSRLTPGKRLRIESGQIELLFDTGVELVIAGRANVVIESPMRVVSTLGKFSARVSERGRGFTIETPRTNVIDLGTEFGVEIAPSGDTKVAVFKGAVDLDFSNFNTPEGQLGKSLPLERLGSGEAVLIDTRGERSRIVSIGADDFPTPGLDRPGQQAEPDLFASVRDNLRAPEEKKFYRIVRGGLFDDARAYVDRDHEWNGLDRNGLPKELRGADYIMAFNDDKFMPSLELTLELSSACTLYIFFDNNMVVPDWLLANFEDTGVDIGLDQARGRYSGNSAVAEGGGMSIDDTFSVWSRRIDSAQSLQLGGVAEPADNTAGWNMYGIAATRAPEPQAGL